MMEYAVIEDRGDQALTGEVAFSAKTQEKAEEWAESENYHSASIVTLNEDGSRTIISGEELEKNE